MTQKLRRALFSVVLPLLAVPLFFGVAAATAPTGHAATPPPPYIPCSTVVYLLEKQGGPKGDIYGDNVYASLYGVFDARNHAYFCNEVEGAYSGNEGATSCGASYGYTIWTDTINTWSGSLTGCGTVFSGNTLTYSITDGITAQMCSWLRSTGNECVTWTAP
jgi:hypothetical protein